MKTLIDSLSNVVRNMNKADRSQLLYHFPVAAFIWTDAREWVYGF